MPLRDPGHLGEHPRVDPSTVAFPSLGLRTGEGVDHLQRVVPGGEVVQLLAADDLLVGAGGVDEAGGHLAADRRPVADHGHERRHPRSPRAARWRTPSWGGGEETRRAGPSLPTAALWRIMAMSGATPDPPATSRSGPPSLASQTNQPPIGPLSSSMSPATSSSVR